MNNTEKRRAEKLIEDWRSNNTQTHNRYGSFDSKELKAVEAEISKLEKQAREMREQLREQNRAAVEEANADVNEKAKRLTFGVWNGDYTFAQLATELN